MGCRFESCRRHWSLPELSKWGLIDNTLEGRQKVYFPWFSKGMVPLDPEANRRWRQKFFNITNEWDREQVRKACREDFLFYCAGFLYLYDAGDESGTPGPVPFIPYEFQVECITLMYACLHDLRCPMRGKKPRRIGFTWLAVALFEHAWRTVKNCHLLVGSHREEEVDGTQAMSKGGRYVGEWSKLLPKFDYLHVYQPPWLLPRGYTPRVEPYRTRMKLMNPANGSIVWGTSAAAAGHGERGYAVLWDEASRTENLYDIIGGLQAFSACKMWISTIGTLGHPFSTMLKNAPGIRQLNPEWWMHPVYSEELTIDPETGQRTSPWLRRKLSEINNDPVKANELYYADETLQVGGYYHPDTFRLMLGTGHAECPGTVMPEFVRGELDIIETDAGPRVVRFCEQPNGRWRLWCRLDLAGCPSRSTKYIQGIDTAAGTTDTQGRGASNSVSCFVDWMTGDVVAEFVCHGVPIAEFERICTAASYWFAGEDFLPARTVPERNGPGAQLVELMRKRGHENLHRDNKESSTEVQFGWHKSGRGEDALLAFGLHEHLLCEGRLKERSAECADEMRHYMRNPNGRGAPIHSASMMSEDPSGARENHGDRVITRVCICQVLQNPYEAEFVSGQAPWGSYKWMKQQREDAKAKGRLVGMGYGRDR